MRMNATIESLNHAPPALRAALQNFATLLERLGGANLQGVTLFGPVLTPEFDPAHELAASVMVLERVDLGLLRRVAEHGSEFGPRGIAAPLVITPGYIRDSLDVFPLELLEIYQLRRTLVGRDFFETIEIDQAHLRLQCERELKRVLIQMRQALLTAGAHEDELGAMEADIGRDVLRTLRGIAWLHGKKQFLSRLEVLADVEQWLGRRLDGVRTVIASPGSLGWPEFESFYADIEKLAERTNAL